jgi:uncharacterized protein with von Willebrand factor type A (vWA) domain
MTGSTVLRIGINFLDAFLFSLASELPYVDEFVAGHSMAAFSDLVEVVARA